MDFIKSLFSDVLSGTTSVLVYAAIVVIFAVGIVRCIMPVVHTRNTLRRAIRSIRSTGDTKYAWQEDRFLGKGTLFAHWSEYLNNLFFADGVYHNASNVEDFINEETVIYGPGRISFSDALPGLMTSLGFLGTLIGLVRGMKNFDISGAQGMLTSVEQLLGGMRYAFTTSIFGVIGSVLFTLITRAVHGSAQHTLTSFYSAMSRYAGVRSVDPMTQIAIYQQEQTALIQTMAKDLNGTFTENIAEAVHSAIDPLNQSFRNFVNVSSKEQMKFMDAVMQRFADRLDASMNGQLKRFGDALDETSRLQQESCVVVRASLSGASQAVADLEELRAMAQSMVKGMGNYVAQINDIQKQNDDAYMRLSSSVEQMELVSRQQNNYLKTVSSMQADVARSVETMTNAVNAFTRRFGEEHAAAAAAMEKASADLRDAAARVGGAQQEANKAIEAELANTLDAYRDYVNQFTQRVDYLASSISDSLGQMPGAVTQTSNQFLDQMDRLTDSLAQARQGLDAAVNRLYERG